MGLEVESVSSIDDGYIMIVQNNMWVVANPVDVDFELPDLTNKEYSLTSIAELNIGDIVNAGDILVFDGNYWVSTADMRLDVDSINNLIESKGYLTEVTMSDLPVGEYDQIVGIGEKIRVTDKLYLNDSVLITGNLIITGDIGDPISTAYFKEVNLINDDGDIVSINSTEDYPLVNKDIMIDGKDGVLLSGQGSDGYIAIFESESEIGYSSQLIWDNALKQFAIGSVSNIDGVKFNVEGNAEVGGLMVNDTLLDLNDYLKESELATVGKTGDYNDLIDAPDYASYLSNDAYDVEMGNYYQKVRWKVKLIVLSMNLKTAALLKF